MAGLMSIPDALAHMMSSVETSLLWELDELTFHQPCYSFSPEKKFWEACHPESSTSNSLPTPASLTIMTWNIDMMAPNSNARMSSALSHLQQLTETQHTGPLLILLQEMHKSDLTLISTSPWIQQRFHITDLDDTNWGSKYYGTTTLVDKRLPIQSCFRVYCPSTRMSRDVLFLDVALSPPHQKTPFVVRIGNTHLESLVANPPIRPSQLSLASHYMKTDPKISFSILAGDMNAIQPFDRQLPSEHGLEDSFLHLGGHEDTKEGYTWGQQAPKYSRERFGCSRMDKILFCEPHGASDKRRDENGGHVMRINQFGKFGQGVEISDETIKKHMIERGDCCEDEKGEMRAWVTDHIGLFAEFSFSPPSPSPSS